MVVWLVEWLIGWPVGWLAWFGSSRTKPGPGGPLRKCYKRWQQRPAYDLFGWIKGGRGSA